MDQEVDTVSLMAEGKSAYQRGDFLIAAQAFSAAARGYKLVEDELNAAEMANNASVAFLQAGDSLQAYECVQDTASVFASVGDRRRQGMALGNLGAALEGLGKLDEAMEAYAQSAEVLEQARENELRAHVLQSLSALQLRRGHQLDALASMQAGLDGLDKLTPQQRLLKRMLRFPARLLKR